MMGILSEEQKKWWARLQQLITDNKIDIKNINQFQRVVKQVALEIIEQMPQEDEIVLFSSADKKYANVLLKFSSSEFSTKKQFIEHHRKSNDWGQDCILYPFLHALGYRATISIANTGLVYEPFTQSSHFGLMIDLVIEGAVSENDELVRSGIYTQGNHWKLAGSSNLVQNPSDLILGSCMYRAIAEQIGVDFPKVQAESINISAPSASIEHAVAVNTSSDHVSARAVTAARATQSTFFFDPEALERHFRKVTEDYESYEKADQQRYVEAKRVFEKLGTNDLIDTYKNALAKLAKLGDKDDYLQNRPLHSMWENNNSVMLDALNNRGYKADEEAFLRKELIHALAKEAWRSSACHDVLFSKEQEIQAPTLKM